MRQTSLANRERESAREKNESASRIERERERVNEKKETSALEHYTIKLRERERERERIVILREYVCSPLLYCVVAPFNRSLSFLFSKVSSFFHPMSSNKKAAKNDTTRGRSNERVQFAVHVFAWLWFQG